MATRKTTHRRNVDSTSRQINYLYNLESKTISAFSNLARKFFAAGSNSTKSTVENVTDIDLTIPVRRPKSRTVKTRDLSPPLRKSRVSSVVIFQQTTKKIAPKKTTTKKAASKKVVKKAAPKKTVKKIAKKKTAAKKT